MEVSRDILFNFYVNENKTITEIAKIFGYKSPQSICNLLKKFNIPTRQKSESQILTKIRKERIGLKKENTFGSIMEVIEYINSSDILVKFENGGVIRAEWGQFNKGTLRNPYDRTIFGVGYIGEGDYKSKIKDKHSHQYRAWYQMFVRAYSKEYHKKFPTYEEVSVDPLWHNFQNFARWYDENFYKVDGERLEIDKDILIKGNKVYSPEKCVLVPQSINSLFTKRDSMRGSLPIGVHYNKRDEKYVAQCMDGKGNKKGLGYHSTPSEAFQSYKTYKEKLIKQIANEYINVIPTKLYEAMLNYIVEIND